ncbi:aromatase/cyclase [Nocardia sp. CDC159]|uniref:Aromatase/cyclase n=1 Tax=Nocardia pulmonis TaxID=2951408 RepID=A0A9X2J1B2_9NOCA|nr:MULTISPECIES: aromatase/cyclase [Nocardia]MCM6778704.1 aromatase/cyclase [Nocardia pulmonis]MCM6791593.1 aromatase/cyclase [Nocardia sp. CDC159]
MTTGIVREVEHEIEIAAPADAVYGLIADVTAWPRIFGPTIHVEYLEKSEGAERIRIWATANGTAKSWTSRRVLDRGERTITFQQEVSAPPVASMSGTWLIEATADNRSRVRLLHGYRAVDDDPEGLAWIDQAVDRNSRSELKGLRASVESATGTTDATFSFEDSVRIDGTAADAYAFIDQAQLWSQRLPHVARVVLEEPMPGLQSLEMDTRSGDGPVHTTKSYRVLFPHHSIVYKQVTLPALMSLHTGRWTFTEDADGVLATSQHTVTIATERIPAVLGADKTLVEAKVMVRRALGANSTATLNLAKAFAEQRG